jgi:hypothetical protein
MIHWFLGCFCNSGAGNGAGDGEGRTETMIHRESPSSPSLNRVRWINRVTRVRLWSQPSDLLKWRSDGDKTINPQYASTLDPTLLICTRVPRLYPDLITALGLIQWRAREHEHSRLIFHEKDQTVVKRDHAVARHTQSRPKWFQIYFFIFCVAFGPFCCAAPPSIFICYLTSPALNFIFIFLVCKFLF